MTYTSKDAQDFKDVCEPVIKWIAENCHPHMCAQIDATHAELLEGQIAFSTDKYIVD